MFWNNKKKKAISAKIYWLVMGNMFIAEHDKTYDNTIGITGIDVAKDTTDYVRGKFLWRTVAASFAICGAGLQGDILENEETFVEFQQTMDLLAVMGTNALRMSVPNDVDFSDIDEITMLDINLMEPMVGKSEEILEAVTQFFVGNDSSLDKLTEVYLECFSCVVTEDSKEQYTERAKNIFQSARHQISRHI
jgi:hypothetical protein